MEERRGKEREGEERVNRKMNISLIGLFSFLSFFFFLFFVCVCTDSF